MSVRQCCDRLSAAEHGPAQATQVTEGLPRIPDTNSTDVLSLLRRRDTNGGNCAAAAGTGDTLRVETELAGTLASNRVRIALNTASSLEPAPAGVATWRDVAALLSRSTLRVDFVERIIGAVLPPYQEALARLSGPVEKVLDDTETPGCRVVPALLFTAKTDIVCLIAGILVEPGRFGGGAVLLTSALTSCALDGPATGLIPDRVFETCLGINPAGMTS